jgi:predicted NBD/HSP70 family sugar kinase
MKNLKKNEWRVIRSILSLKNATRILIANETKLSLVKISSVLNILETNKYIMKTGKTKSKSGRPSFIYKVLPELGYVIGASIKPGSLRIVVIDCSKELIMDKKFDLKLFSDPFTHVQSIVNQVSRELKRVISDYLPRRDATIAIGLALPGMVDTDRNIWLQGMQMTGISQVNLVQELQNQFNIPIFIEDVARTLAYLEKVRFSDQGIDNFVLLYLDLGVGTGIIINNEIYRGYHGVAGEIGHVGHANNNYRCSCNNVGCLETVVSAPGILRIFRERLKEGVRSTLQKFNHDGAGDMTLEDILSAARKSDRVAMNTLFEIGEFLGEACATLIKLFNPQRIVISGYVAIFKDFFQEPIQKIINQQVMEEMLSDFAISFSNYAFNQEAYGAALFALDQYLVNRLNNSKMKK